MNPTTLQNHIKEITIHLLRMVKDCCYNTISPNCTYIISKIDEDLSNFDEDRIRRNKQNKLKKPISLVETIAELKKIYDDLYDVNLFIYHAKQKETIIDIRYYPKSAFKKADFEKIKDNEPMFHSKIRVPLYQRERENFPKMKEEKFDVNWELGGIRHRWKLFCHKLKIIEKTHY